MVTANVCMAGSDGTFDFMGEGMIVNFDGTILAHGTSGRADEIITAEVRPDPVRRGADGLGRREQHLPAGPPRLHRRPGRGRSLPLHVHARSRRRHLPPALGRPRQDHRRHLLRVSGTGAPLRRADFDADDPWSKPSAGAVPRPLPPAFKVGIPSGASRRFFGDAEQAAAYAAALEAVAALGGDLVELDFASFYEVGRLLYGGPWIAERYAVVEALLGREPSALHPVTREVIAAAREMSAVDAFRGFYRLADLRRAIEPQLAGLDMLCVPTVYTRSELEADPLGPNARLGTYTSFVNLLDLCGIAVPTAPRRAGWPGGVTLLASAGAGADGLLAAVAGTLPQRAGVMLGATTWCVGTA